MFQVTIGEYNLNLVSEGLPELYNSYIKNALLLEELDINNSEGKNCFVSVGRNNDWPFLVVAQRYSPFGYGFNPGILLIPETNILFVGAGERLLCYDLLKPRRIWEDFTEVGFWHWSQFEKFILMSAEIEFAVWNQEGKKLWSTFVEPPWGYQVKDNKVVLDVMGKMSTFNIELGPTK